MALRKFLKKDTVGWGYTMFLPWGSCQPDVTKVHLTCRYDPAGGGQPLFAAVQPLTLEHVPPPSGLAQALTAPQPPGQPAAAAEHADAVEVNECRLRLCGGPQSRKRQNN